MKRYLRFAAQEVNESGVLTWFVTVRDISVPHPYFYRRIIKGTYTDGTRDHLLAPIWGC